MVDELTNSPIMDVNRFEFPLFANVKYIGASAAASRKKPQKGAQVGQISEA